MTTELLDHVAHNSEGFEVEELVAAKKAYEVLIKWRGLQDLESSWEPAASIKEDVPALFRAFCMKKKAPAIVVKMAKDHEVKRLMGEV